jgi:bifunctional ADP-heptose synthase (sugar kinase/adenylyltransferase)
VLAALKVVNGVIIFPETTATMLIATLQPEIYAKGGDYQIATLPEASTVQAYGGRIELIAIEVPTSTSAIVNRICTQALNDRF